MILIPLRSNAEPTLRADLAVAALEMVIDEIQAISSHLRPEHLAQIDAAESRLLLLRTGMAQRKNLSSLCGMFGRLKPEQNQGAAP